MLKLGIIGAGIMGERMLRAAVEHAADIVEITGVWDAAPEALDRIGAIGAIGARRADCARAVVESADCVYIATPPSSHLDYAEQAFAAGKAVFLEKPLAVDFEASRAFVRRHDGKRAAVNFPMASSFAVEALQGWIENGATGAPGGFAIEVAFVRWPRFWQQGAASWLAGAAEGGFTREVVSHFLFLSRRLLGPLSLLSARTRYEELGTERAIEARIDAGGLRGTVSGAIGTTTEDDVNSWTLRGVGAIRLRNWSIAERQRPDGSWVADPSAMPNEKARPLVLRRQLEQVGLMTSGESHRLARLFEALEVQAVVEGILRA